MGGNSLLPNGILSMTAQAADRLIGSGSGDEALLYLHILRRGGELSPDIARGALGWTDDRVLAAFRRLKELGLIEGAMPQKENVKLAQEEPPDYSSEDIKNALTGEKTFPMLVSEVQSMLGKVLSPSDLKTLLAIYDYLALPPEVILMLTAWCIEETQRRHGAGRMPTMPQLKREAQRWHDLGVDTAKAADAHIRAALEMNSREKVLLPRLGIGGRPPIAAEKRHISAWVNMGFTDDAIVLAYERTILQKGSISWPYMNSILKSWHAANLHTVEQIEAGDRPAQTYRRKNEPAKVDSGRMLDDMALLDKMLDKTDKRGEG